MPRRSNKQPHWVNFRDEDLLAMKFAGLKLRLEKTPLFTRVHQLYDELGAWSGM